MFILKLLLCNILVETLTITICLKEIVFFNFTRTFLIVKYPVRSPETESKFIYISLFLAYRFCVSTIFLYQKGVCKVQKNCTHRSDICLSVRMFERVSLYGVCILALHIKCLLKKYVLGQSLIISFTLLLLKTPDELILCY